MFRPSIFLSCMACPTDPGVEAGTSLLLPDYVHLASGDGPVWVETTFDDDGLATQTFKYLDTNGDIQMTTGNSVGTNAVPGLTQKLGSFTYDVFANGADVTKTAADIIADAIAAGAQVKGSDNVAQALVATDYIALIDMDLKPIGGHGDDAGVQVTATAADATYTVNGGTTDVDPGGSRETGQISADAFKLSTDFQTLTVKDGSIVTIAVDFATIPA